jgi:hypothetical protein
LGVAKAKELIFTGRALNPEQALEFGRLYNQARLRILTHVIGVVDYVSELGLTKAFELAEEIATGGETAHFDASLEY